MSLINIFSRDQLNTEIIDYHTYQFIRAHNLVYPRYNKITLSELQNTYHEQAHLFKSRLIKGFSFKDEDNAQKVKDFLDTSIIDLFERDITFLKHLHLQMYYYAKYNCFYDSAIFSGKNAQGTPAYWTQVDPKYFYWDKEKRTGFKIVPNAQLQSLNNEPGSQGQNYNYSCDSKEFVRLGYEKRSISNLGKERKLITGSDQRVAEFSGMASISDYYANIPYLEAMGSMEVNHNIGTYDKGWLENGSNFKNILQLNGLDENDPKDRRIINRYKTDFNNAAKHGQVFVIANPDPENPDAIKFLTMQQATKENFNETRDINRDEILASNGLNPTLLGIKTNESSLTSTSQAEALNLYKETFLDSFIADLQAHYDKQFKIIDPNYETNVIFKTISFEDELKKAQIEAQELANETILIARDNIEMFNEYRRRRNKEEVEQADFDKMVKNYNSAGLNLGMDIAN